jgi:tryptophanase
VNDDTLKELAELAVEKDELTRRLTAVRSRMKALARDVDLPVCIETDGHAVLIKKAQYRDGVPQATFAPLLKLPS